ncbi:uncharacterized protein LY89DRAFT_731450 [Mollisia scopiformis]|uniref:Uncharacterized protein n=1 Tax=Mollisia scopiformis TaxID=149040 RepID=A0A194XJ00_MOLSC|nr:uncharacterized protein LY89DRAFT_731450 [Mollisia scopiformis]KUJ20225.1 hypothetical protein LY89DRAFT_731450 [Mollisia scopiformis]
MLRKTLANARSGTLLQKYAPLVSLFLGSASFILTLLVVIPGTKRGALENFHLITLNTSNIGAEAVTFTPVTAALREDDKHESVTATIWNSTSGRNSSNLTNSTTTENNSTTSARPSSTPATNLTASSSSYWQAAQPVTTTSAGDPVASAIQSLTAGLENSLVDLEGDIGTFIEGLIQNITQSIESGGEGGISQFFDNIFQNLTAGLTHGSSTGIGALLDGILSIGAGNPLAASGSSLTQLFSDLVGNFTAGLDNGLSKAEGSVAQGIVSALGIEEFYSIHLRDVCAGSLSNAADPHARFNISNCFSYGEAASGLTRLISNIPSSTTVLTTNISIPAIAQVQSISVYLGNLTNTLDRTIFAFYLISLAGSAFVVLASLLQFLLPSSKWIMNTNLVASSIGSLFLLSASATATAFITTANNIINLFGSALGLKAELGTGFLILTWLSFVVSLLETCTLLAVWFVEFRTISVKVQRRSPQDFGNWRRFGVLSERKEGFVESVGELPTETEQARERNIAARRLSSRHTRRSSKAANF